MMKLFLVLQISITSVVDDEIIFNVALQTSTISVVSEPSDKTFFYLVLNIIAASIVSDKLFFM